MDEFDYLYIQALIDNGNAWKLEGSIGRMCMDAIQSGYAMLGEIGVVIHMVTTCRHGTKWKTVHQDPRSTTRKRRRILTMRETLHWLAIGGAAALVFFAFWVWDRIVAPFDGDK